MKDLVSLILKELAGYLTILVGLLSGPKTFVSNLGQDGSKTLADAFQFLGISYALTVALALGRRSAEDFVQRSIGDAAFGLVMVFANGAVLHGIMKASGGKASFEKNLTAFVYFSAVGWLLASTSILLILGLLMVYLPDIFPLVKNSLVLGYVRPDVIIETLDRLVQTQGLRALLLYELIGSLVILVDDLWFFIVWGYFRQENKISIRRSGAAFVYYLVLSKLLLIPAILLMFGFRSPPS